MRCCSPTPAGRGATTASRPRSRPNDRANRKAGDDGEADGTPALGAPCVPFVLLEDRLSSNSEAVLYAGPREVIEAHCASEVRQALSVVDAAVAQGLHAVGFLSYEAAGAFEPRLTAPATCGDDPPLLWFGLFAAPCAVSAPNARQ